MRISGLSLNAVMLAPALILAVGPGCQKGDSTSRSGGWNRSPHESAAAIDGSEATHKIAHTESASPPGISIFDLAFDVTRVELPIDSGRSSLKIWNHVDMMRINAQSSASLARNGLRLGVGTPQSWPAIRAIIEHSSGKAYRDQVGVPRGQPLLLDLGPVPEQSAVFAFDRAGRLSGRTFDAGRFMVQLDYDYQAGAARALDVQLSLEVRTDHGEMTWERQGAVIRQVPSIDRHLFEGVRAVATLRDGEFLVLGADGDQSGAYLVGNQCTTGERNGVPIEIVLFLTPKIVQTEGVANGRRSG